jgi:hypothetical protein
MNGKLGSLLLKSAPNAKTALIITRNACQNALEICEMTIMNEDNSRKEIDRKKEELLNKLLNKSTIITSFSVSPEDVPILEGFRKIAKREAGSRGFSQVLVKAMAEYSKRHSLGNPQLLITHYAKPEEPQPIRVLCILCDGATSDGKIYCEKAGGMWIPSIRCYSCKFNRLRKGSS